MNNLPAMQETWFNPWIRKTWKREWLPTTIFFSRKPHGQRNLAGFLQFMGSQRVGHD